MTSLELLDIPWFAFDVPEYGTACRGIDKSSTDPAFRLTGWDPGSSPSRKPQLISPQHRHSSRTRPNYHGTLYSASMNPSTPIDFLFRHYEDIDQYIVDYRTYHTHRQTGGTRGYRPTSGSEYGANICDINSHTISRDNSMKQAELLHILRHSQNQKLKRDHSSPKLNSNPDIQSEEGEDDYQSCDITEGDNPEVTKSNNRWRYTRKGRLLNRPTSSSSSISLNNVQEVKTPNLVHAQPESPSFQLCNKPPELTYRQIQQQSNRQTESAKCHSPGERNQNIRTNNESTLISKRRALQIAIASPPDMFKAKVWPMPGQNVHSSRTSSVATSNLFVGSTIKKTPQNGLPAYTSPQKSSKGQNSVPLKSGQKIVSTPSTHSTLSALRHQYIHRLNRYGILGFGLMNKAGPM